MGVSGAGDPYFLGKLLEFYESYVFNKFLTQSVVSVGFDGQVFKFDGKNDHAYNLITAPYLHLNSRLHEGLSSTLPYRLRTVISDLVIFWEDSRLSFAIDRWGNL